MTRRTSPNAPGAAPDENNPRGRHMQERSHQSNERNGKMSARPGNEEAVNMQRGDDFDYDIGERRPSGTKGEMTNSDEIY